MKRLLVLSSLLFTSIYTHAGFFKDGGKITFSGKVVSSECRVSNDTQKVIQLDDHNMLDVPFNIQFTDCNEGQRPNVSFSIYDVNDHQDSTLVSTYVKNEAVAAPHVALQLLDQNKKVLQVDGRNYDLAETEVMQNLNLNFSARYVTQTPVKTVKNMESTIVFAIHYH